jgi:hypothetical protein
VSPSAGIASAHRVRRAPALLVGGAAFAVYPLVFVIFNR